MASPGPGPKAIGSARPSLRRVLRVLTGSFRDLVPIVLVIGFFQIVVLQQPFPNLERMLGERGLSSLVVERRDEHDEFGLLVIADIARDVIARNRAPERVNVYEIMSKPVLTLPAEMKIRYAVRLPVRFGLSRAVVVDRERRPLGIATLRDKVLRYGAQ